MKNIVLIILVATTLITTGYGRWGWGSHRFINAAAVDHLPPEMAFFQDHRSYLEGHSIDPDTDGFPGNYHYIDIDYYPEFFTGTLPSEWQDMVNLYGTSTMEDNGLVPWVIEWWMDDLNTLMAAGDWNNVWQIAAELGHYVADSHQALHLTLNYNGQMTNNYGIHSRYETEMINSHLDAITFPDSIAGYWDSPVDSVFDYVSEIYPIVDLIMAADDRAYQVDSNHGNTYYSMMWDDLADTTIWTLNRAVIDLASVWYTAWINAGSPYPPGVNIVSDQRPMQFILKAYPNPFNPRVQLSFQLETGAETSLKIFDINGRLVRTLESGYLSQGTHLVHWDGRGQNLAALSSGIYICELQSSGHRIVQKLSLMK